MLKKPVRIKFHLPISSGSSAASIRPSAKDKVRKATIFYFTFYWNIYVKNSRIWHLSNIYFRTSFRDLKSARCKTVTTIISAIAKNIFK